MYFHAALQGFEVAKRCEPRIKKAERAASRLQDRADAILEACEEDGPDPYDELEPIYRQMESADYDIGAAHVPRIQALAITHILCAASLESYVTGAALGSLKRKPRALFKRFSLEAKWMALPKFLGLAGFDVGRQPFQGFAQLVRFRNALVHYKPRTEEWTPLVVAVPTFLAKLGLTMDAADASIKATRGMVLELTKQMGTREPWWLSERGVPHNYFEVVSRGGSL